MSAASDAGTVSSPAKYVDELPVYSTPSATATAIARRSRERVALRPRDVASTHSQDRTAPIENRHVIRVSQSTPVA
jgi:hypothetical protein